MVTWLQLLERFLLPELCVHCGRAGAFVCADCFELIEWPTAHPTLPEQSSLSSLHCVALFSPPISELLHTLKYRFVKNIGHWLGVFVYYYGRWPPNCVVTAVPTSPSRKRFRGFNQAEVIAKSFCQAAQLPYLPLLSKANNARSQVGKNRAERFSNTQHVFVSNSGVTISPTQVVLLIDDVYTTGATLAACATEITKKWGCPVHGLTVAWKK